MSSVLSNPALKSRNEKIFKSIEKKLASDDESAFVGAADKVRSFVERREAYYPEARPLIGSICKTARATLTRLANSDIPFHCGRPFPPELKARAAAYTRLIKTVLDHARTGIFENDHPLKEELKDLFSSITVAPSRSSESTKLETNRKSSASESSVLKKQTQPKLQVDMAQNGSRVVSHQPIDPARGGSTVSSLSIPPANLSETRPEQCEGQPQETSPLVLPSSAIGVKGTTSSSTTSPLQVTAPSTLVLPRPPDVGTAPTEFLSHVLPLPSEPCQSIDTRSNSFVKKSPIDPPTVILSPTATLKSTADEVIPPGKETVSRPAVKTKKKPKLGRAALVNSTLLQEDLNWYSTRQRKASGLHVSVGSPTAIKEEHGSPSLPVDLVSLSVVDSSTETATKEVVEVTDPISTSEPPPLRSERADTVTATGFSDADIAVNLRPDLSWAEQSKPVVQPRFLSEIVPLPSDMSIPMDISLDQEERTQHDSEPLAQVRHSPPASGSQLQLPVSVGTNSPPVLEEGAQGRPCADTIGIEAKVSDEVRRSAQLEDASAEEAHTEAMDVDDSRATETSGPSLIDGTSEQECEGGSSLKSQDVSNQAPRLPPIISTDEEFLKASGCRSGDPGGPEKAPKSIFGPNTVVFASIDLGRDAGDVVTMEFELTSDQKDLLSRWQTRDQHEGDSSNSICLSLACYKTTDVLEAGLNLENENGEFIPPVLLELTPSWPTNARLSADIGISRLFLAPPLQTTDENLVDITPFVDENHIEIRLDHAGDMKNYIFALLAHPPTPSQLQVLEERRTKIRKFHTVLDGLRLTAVDVFG